MPDGKSDNSNELCVSPDASEPVHVPHFGNGELPWSGSVRCQSGIGQQTASRGRDDTSHLTEFPHAHDDHRLRPTLVEQFEKAAIIGPRINHRSDFGNLTRTLAYTLHQSTKIGGCRCEIVKRSDHLCAWKRRRELVIDVDITCAVLDCVLKDANFFFDGSVEVTAAFFSA